MSPASGWSLLDLDRIAIGVMEKDRSPAGAARGVIDIVLFQAFLERVDIGANQTDMAITPAMLGTPFDRIRIF